MYRCCKTGICPPGLFLWAVRPSGFDYHWSGFTPIKPATFSPIDKGKAATDVNKIGKYTAIDTSPPSPTASRLTHTHIQTAVSQIRIWFGTRLLFGSSDRVIGSVRRSLANLLRENNSMSTDLFSQHFLPSLCELLPIYFPITHLPANQARTTPAQLNINEYGDTEYLLVSNLKRFVCRKRRA